MVTPARGCCILCIVVLLISNAMACAQPQSSPEDRQLTVDLPQPRLRGVASLEESLHERRSVREYSEAPMTLEEVSQLLWAGQGLTSDRGGRTAPSAGALYPMELYLVAGNVSGLPPGVYKYQPVENRLAIIKEGDLRESLARAAANQTWMKDGAVEIVVAAVQERTTVKYGERGVRYVYIEAGHVAQNVLLQATAMDLGAVPVGAFYEDQVIELLDMPENEAPLYIIPVGRLP